MRLLQLTLGKTASNLQKKKKQSASCPAPRQGINLSLGNCMARAPAAAQVDEAKHLPQTGSRLT
jgi:hypothetical protein